MCVKVTGPPLLIWDLNFGIAEPDDSITFPNLTIENLVSQILNVLIGDMSFVGPRPCLFNQKKLIFERNKLGVFKIKPGITGLAQLQGINMSTPSKLAKADYRMISNMNISNYFYYIFLTTFFIFKSKKTKTN